MPPQSLHTASHPQHGQAHGLRLRCVQAAIYRSGMEQFLHDLSWVAPWRSEALTVYFRSVTELGYTPFFLLFLPLGFWLWDKSLFTRMAVLIVVTALVNSFLKDLFQDPRPDPSFALDAERTSTSYGLPSGHAQVATAMWFWLAYEMRRAWAWGLAIVIIASVCLSRLYLGVHDVEDVIAGVLLGLATLVVFKALLADEFQGWRDVNPGLQIAIILALHPILYLLWPGDKGPGAVASLGGFLIGWVVGFLLAKHRWNVARHENLLVAVLAAVIGMVGVIAAFLYLGKALGAMGLPPMAAQWVQSLIIAVYVTLLAPLLFRMARLAR
jgi:membrane-associated phospholipid phosphatase